MYCRHVLKKDKSHRALFSVTFAGGKCEAVSTFSVELADWLVPMI